MTHLLRLAGALRGQSLKNGQGVTEFIVLLFIVLVVCGLVLSIFGDIGTLGTARRAADSHQYFSVLPIAITGVFVNTSSAIVSLQSNIREDVNITSLRLEGVELLSSSVYLTTYNRTFVVSQAVNGTRGTQFSYAVSIDYVRTLSGIVVNYSSGSAQYFGIVR